MHTARRALPRCKRIRHAYASYLTDSLESYELLYGIACLPAIVPMVEFCAAWYYTVGGKLAWTG